MTVNGFIFPHDSPKGEKGFHNKSQSGRTLYNQAKIAPPIAPSTMA